MWKKLRKKTFTNYNPLVCGKYDPWCLMSLMQHQVLMVRHDLLLYRRVFISCTHIEICAQYPNLIRFLVSYFRNERNSILFIALHASRRRRRRNWMLHLEKGTHTHAIYVYHRISSTLHIYYYSQIWSAQKLLQKHSCTVRWQQECMCSYITSTPQLVGDTAGLKIIINLYEIYGFKIIYKY